jgi:hypothetical protein
MTNETTDRPAGDLLAKLQAVWGRPNTAETHSALRGAVESSHRRGDVTGAQIGATMANEDPPPPPVVVVSGCGSHLPPFDGIEMPDPRRAGWVRVTCRKCGRFLGYAMG